MKSADSTLQPSVREELVLLAANLLSSARGLLDEPKDYGPMRCLGAASRVLELLEQEEASEPRLVAVRTRIDDVLTGPQNHDHTADFLDGLCEQVAVVVTQFAQPDRPSGGGPETRGSK
ncbi:DUF6092 family protein [Streptomyces sp. NPDC029674]|uniref:DUF6092 family protein n=1 Tax=Streptomyces sp. NPDC029674 TaxID=3365297 RepID=UPI00384FD328